jgi:hypothetical protein
MIDFRETRIRFDPTEGQTQQESQRVPFGRQVRRASAAIKAMRIGYTDGDHHVWRLTTDLDATPSGTDVVVTLRYLLRDSTGNVDDRYDGDFEIMVVADVV